jgi:hypothetical protein
MQWVGVMMIRVDGVCVYTRIEMLIDSGLGCMWNWGVYWLECIANIPIFITFSSTALWSLPSISFFLTKKEEICS